MSGSSSKPISSTGKPQAQFAVADLDLSGGHVDDAFDRLLELFAASGDDVRPWAAHATMPDDFAPDARPLQLTGEMILPWMFEEMAELRPFRAATEALHARTEWPELYDVDRLAARGER